MPFDPKQTVMVDCEACHVRHESHPDYPLQVFCIARLNARVNLLFKIVPLLAARSGISREELDRLLAET